MKRLDDYILYADGDPQWLLSNVWDEPERCFFLEVFSRPDENHAWERAGAYYIDDAANEKDWFARFHGSRQEFSSGDHGLPDPARPLEHVRDGNMAIHHNAARSVGH